MSDPVSDFSRHYARALGGSAYNDAFVSHFYKTFMGKSEEIAERFRETDMTAQKTALFDSLLFMAEFPHSQSARARIIQLGHSHSHRALNISPALYDLWLEALIDTARQFDAEFDGEAELSWRVTMAPGIACMKFMYTH